VQLAWFNTADLYIGQGLAILRLNARNTYIFEHPLTMPLDRVLASCQGLAKKGTKFRIVLSSSLCSAFKVQIPSTVVKPSEINALLSASAQQQLNAIGIQFDCLIDANNKSVAAAIPSQVRHTIQIWAIQQGCSIVSLRPLWAAATQFSMCQHPNIKGLALHEPDGSILLTETLHLGIQILTWRGRLTADVIHSNLRRALVSFDMAEQQLLSLHFEAKPATVMQNAPMHWHEHWSEI
jgi:hypothetical protein